jgi:integral membrane sensor domain MASE1
MGRLDLCMSCTCILRLLFLSKQFQQEIEKLDEPIIVALGGAGAAFFTAPTVGVTMSTLPKSKLKFTKSVMIIESNKA